MNEQKKLAYRWLIAIGLAIVAASVCVALLRSPKSATLNRITVSVDSKGTAYLGGVPLVTTNFRDAAFAALGAVGVKAGFTAPLTCTNPVLESNVIETLKSMTRAGLFSTNQPPNPYE